MDSTPPTAFALLDPPDAAVLDDPRPRLSWASSEDRESGLGGYDVEVDGAIVARVPADATSYVSGELADGPHVWSVAAVDAAGNRRSSAARGFRVSTAPDAALVVKSTAQLVDGDAAIKARMEGLGWEVQLLSETAPVSAVAGADVVLISSTVGGAAVGARFRDVTVPVIIWEGGIYDDMGMTQASGTFYGEPTSLNSLTVPSSAHPLAAGLAGTRLVTTSRQTFKWGRAGASATTIATIPGDSSRAAIFAYEAGAAMPGATARDKRVGLFLHDRTAAALNADGWRLVDAALRWTVPAATPPPPHHRPRRLHHHRLRLSRLPAPRCSSPGARSSAPVTPRCGAGSWPRGSL